jgi:hypothetical protein
MDDDPAPALRRIIGRCLRQYREGVGYALDVAARVLDCDSPGRRRNPDDIGRLHELRQELGLCGI